DLGGRDARVGVQVGVWNVAVPVEVVLLDVRQDPGQPAPVGGPCVVAPVAGHERVVGQVAVCSLVIVAGKGELLEVVAATGPVGRFAHALDGWQQHGDQHGNDGDDDQQFDQGKPG